MYPKTFRIALGAALVLLLVLPVASSGAEEPVIVKNHGISLEFIPQVEAQDMTLTVTGPCNYKIRRTLREDGELYFKLDETTIDGMYRFEVTVIPRIDGAILDVLSDARKTGDNSEVDKLCREGALPGDPLIQTAGFRVFDQKIQWDPEQPEDFGGSVPKLGDQDVPSLNKDFVIIDDLIVDGSACIGFDCVNGESFGFDTLRLKENNLRIKFDDTSTAASFPRNDWQLTANDSANGGASKFSIDDISGSRTPFTVEANARSHSLYVDDGGRIGSRTSTPSVEIHTIDGDTPTLRLQQDGSSGFAPQTWDVAGNETNFFVRDVTNGSTLPLRIRPGAPSSAIFIDVDGDVGVGTSSPDADTTLHVVANTGSPNDVVFMENNSATRFALSNTSHGDVWRFNYANSGEFRIGDSDADVEFQLDGAGNLEILGEITTSGSCSGGCDRVFSADYPLPSIEDHAEFMWQNSYLPGVGPTPEDGTFNITKKVGGLLNELEKAHIYIDQLNGTVQSQNEALAAQQEQIQALAARLAELEEQN